MAPGKARRETRRRLGPEIKLTRKRIEIERKPVRQEIREIVYDFGFKKIEEKLKEHIRALDGAEIFPTAINREAGLVASDTITRFNKHYVKIKGRKNRRAFLKDFDWFLLRQMNRMDNVLKAGKKLKPEQITRLNARLELVRRLQKIVRFWINNPMADNRPRIPDLPDFRKL